MPYDMDTSAMNTEYDTMAVGDDRPPGFTPAFSFPMDPANSARFDDVSCVRCNQNLEIRRLVCSHSICGTCFQSSEAGIVCPLCGHLTAADSVEETMANGHITRYGIRCSCQDNAVAKFYCFECDEFQCGKCREAHLLVRYSKDHQIEEFTELMASLSPSSAFCPVHHEQLSIFCRRCECMLCRRCMSIEHQGHQDYETDLKEKFHGDRNTRNLLEALASILPSKKDLLRTRHQAIKDMQLKVVQNRAETQAALENVRETLKKRIDEIFNELERRSQKEETAYAGASKATRDMMLISSYVGRLTKEAFESGQSLDQRRVLQLLDYSFAKLKSINELLIQEWHRPFPTFGKFLDHLAHQTAKLGSLDSAHQQQYPMAPLQPAGGRCVTVQSSMGYFPQQQPRFPMPYPAPNVVIGPNTQYRLPMGYQQQSQQQAYPQQQYQQPQPRFPHVQLQQQWPSCAQAQAQAQPQLPYVQQSTPSVPYQRPFGLPPLSSVIPNVQSQWPSCSFQTQQAPIPITVVRVPLGTSSVTQGQTVGDGQQLQTQQFAVQMPCQYQTNAAVLNIPTAKTPPMTNTEIPPTPSAPAPAPAPASNAVKPAANADPNTSLIYELLKTYASIDSAQKKRKRAPAKPKEKAPKPPKPAQPEAGAPKKKVYARRVTKTVWPSATAQIPTCVRSVVDDVVNAWRTPCEATNLLVNGGRVNLEFGNDHLARSTPICDERGPSVAANIEIETNGWDESGPPQDVLVSPSLASVPSPCEQRLVIDETDSGVESAIAIEEEAEIGAFAKEIKEEFANDTRLAATVVQKEDAIQPQPDNLDATVPEHPAPLAAFAPQDHQPAASVEDEVLIESPTEESFDESCCICATDVDQDALRCRTCRRVFHNHHHIPPICDGDPQSGAKGAWQCTFCIDLAALRSADVEPIGVSEDPQPYEQKACERILLELYAHPDSTMFHEPVEAETPGYYQRITRPMDFATIRKKLITGGYGKAEEFLADLDLTFNNNYVFFRTLNPGYCAAGALVSDQYRQLVSEYFPELLYRVQLLAEEEDGPSSKKTHHD